MPKQGRESITLNGAEGDQLNAIWSRSGRRLIVTVRKRDQWAQVELRPDQVDTFARFLAEKVAQPPDER